MPTEFDSPRLSRRGMLRLSAMAGAGIVLPRCGFGSAIGPHPPEGEQEIVLGDAGLRVIFERKDTSLFLRQIQLRDHPPLLYSDAALQLPGDDATGNPLFVEVLDGPSKGSYGMNTFEVTCLKRSTNQLTVYLRTNAMPLSLGLEITAEGNVVCWRGQAVWNGQNDTILDIYFPLLSRIRFDSAERDRFITGAISGAAIGPTKSVRLSGSYIGDLSSPVFMVEGGGRGLAFLDDNRADYAADAGGCCRRSCVVGSAPGQEGPCAGWKYSRLFLGASRFGGQAEYDEAESPHRLPMEKLGDSVDLGPIYTYAYEGNWKQGAMWLREKRQFLTFRNSPAEWYRQTTILSEESPDRLVRTDGSLYDLPLLLEERHQVGSDMMSLPGFAEPEILGTDLNMLNRGDYFYPARNLGGWDAMRLGVEAMHRQGGHLLLYVEGLIVWKRSRIGRSRARDWALMNADGKLTENYRGFFDMCPAEPGWQDWFARTLADIVRTTGVDGFFMDSMLATDNHRCFNPKHSHAPQVDIWNWGTRRVLARVREEVDKVNPNTILLCEGAGDLAREFIDGTLSHGHAWSGMTFTVPLLRFLHPQMRAFEASGQWPRAEGAPVWPVKRPLLWNAVQGYRVFTELENHEQIASLSHMVRVYFDMYPEICDADVSVFDVEASNCLSQLFECLPRIVTCGNDADEARIVTLIFPKEVHVAELFDRRDQKRIPVIDQKTSFNMNPWELRAFELRA